MRSYTPTQLYTVCPFLVLNTIGQALHQISSLHIYTKAMMSSLPVSPEVTLCLPVLDANQEEDGNQEDDANQEGINMVIVENEAEPNLEENP